MVVPYLPIEIWRSVWDCVVADLPLADVFRTRLVNSTFATEIWSLLLKSHMHRIDQHLSCHDQNWIRFPERLKRQYLFHKAKKHPIDRNVFSDFIEEILDSEPEYRNNSQARDEAMRRLVEAFGHWTPQPHSHAAKLLMPDAREDWYQWYTKGQYQFQSREIRHIKLGDKHRDLLIGLACSAIKRGDCAELEILLEKGVKVHCHSHRLGNMPVFQFAIRGNRKIAALFAKKVTPSNMSITEIPSTIATAVSHGNFDILDEWFANGLPLLHSSHDGGRDMIQKGLYKGVMRIVRSYNASSDDKPKLDFILKHYPGDKTDLIIEFLNLTLRFGKPDMIKHMFQKVKELGGDPAQVVSRLKKGLFAVLDTTSGHHYPLSPEHTEVMKLLLEHGADPNRTYNDIHETVLQKLLIEHGAHKYCANKHEMLKLCIQYGADVNAWNRCPSLTKSQCRGPPLFLAVQTENWDAAGVLLGSGANPAVVWDGLTIWMHAIRAGARGDRIHKWNTWVYIARFGRNYKIFPVEKT